MKSIHIFAAFALCIVSSSVSNAAFLVPGSAPPIFEDWTRSTTANSVYAEWNVFTDAAGGTNSPDVGQFGLTGATVVEDSPGAPGLAFVTGSGNIYSFSIPTSFDVAVPSYGLGAGWNTRIVAQIGTQGTDLLKSSLQLTYNNGGRVTSAPTALYNRGLSGPKREWLAVWDISNFNPSNSLIEFAASGSSMSLDTLAVDTFTQAGTFASLPVAIPEPASLVIVGLATSGALMAGRRRRVC